MLDPVMERRTLGKVLLVAAASAAAGACGGGGGGAGGTGTGGGEVTEVKLGSVNSLSGTAASSGTDVRNGEELAVELINTKQPDLKLPFAADEGLPNLKGAKVKFIAQDDQGNAETAANAVSNLATEQKVAAIVGGYASAVTSTGSARAERLQIPFVNGSSSAVELTERNLKWFFRVGPNDATFTGTMFDLFKAQAGKGNQVKTVALLHTNDTYGNGVEKEAKAAAEKAGYQVAVNVAYDKAAQDLTPQILQIKGGNPDAVLVSSYTTDTFLLMRGLKAQNWYPKALIAYGAGFSDPTFLPTLGADANGAMSRAAWSVESPNDTSKKVAAMFEKKYGRPMTENSARGFSSVYAVAVAINNAKSVDPTAIRGALEKLDIPADQLITPWGGIKFDAKHQNEKANGIIQQVQDGKYKTVFPEKSAVGPVKWPMRG